jgi:hypothetical protein
LILFFFTENVHRIFSIIRREIFCGNAPVRLNNYFETISSMISLSWALLRCVAAVEYSGVTYDSKNVIDQTTTFRSCIFKDRNDWNGGYGHSLLTTFLMVAMLLAPAAAGAAFSSLNVSLFQ